MTREQALFLYDKIKELGLELKDAKPDERTELARRMQICITEQEKLMAYYYTFVLNCEG